MSCTERLLKGTPSCRGRVSDVGGIRVKAEAAKKAGAKTLVCPKKNAEELLASGGVEGLRVVGITNLLELIKYSIYPYVKLSSTFSTVYPCRQTVRALVNLHTRPLSPPVRQVGRLGQEIQHVTRPRWRPPRNFPMATA